MTGHDVELHLPMVRKIARTLCRRLPSEVQYDEMVSAGSMGLVEAAERFDSSRSVCFEAYAGLRVRGAMLDALRSNCSSSRGARRRARKVERCRSLLVSRLGRDPEREELEEALGADAAHLDEVSASRIVSLDHTGAAQEEQAPLLAKLEDSRPGVLEILVREQTRQSLAAALNRLSERHRLVLSLCYFEELNLKEIGEVLGVTESRACQVRQEALRKLRVELTGTD